MTPRSALLGTLLAMALGLPLPSAPPPGSVQEKEAAEAFRGRYSQRANFHHALYLGTGEGREIFGLMLHDSQPKGELTGSLTRYLLSGSGGSGVIITSVLRPRGGELVVRLQEDTSLWWAEVTLDWAETFEDLDDFLAIGQVRVPWPESKLRLQTKGGARFEGTTDGEEIELLNDRTRFLAALRASEVASQIAGEIPPEVRETIAFLEAFELYLPMGPVDVEKLYTFPWRDITRPLAECLRADSKIGGKRADLAPRARQGSIRGGLLITDPELLEFVSRFKSVDNARPLPEEEIRALLGGQAPRQQ